MKMFLGLSVGALTLAALAVIGFFGIAGATAGGRGGKRWFNSAVMIFLVVAVSGFGLSILLIGQFLHG